MKKKLSIIAIFCIYGVVNSFCNENPLVIFDYSRELNIDSMKPVLEAKGYSCYEEKPRIYGSEIYGDFEVTCYENGASDQYIISLLHTPKTRIVYSIEINREISNKRFLQETIQFYKVIEKKYGVPVSGEILNDDYIYADDKEHKKEINTKEIKLDSAYLVSCIESKQPVEYCWFVNNNSICFSIHQLSHYSPHIICKIYNKGVEELNSVEIKQIKEELDHHENMSRLKKIIFGTFIIAFFLFLIYQYRKASQKYNKEQKEKEVAKQKQIEAKQNDVDIKREKYKKILIEKYGNITRILSNTYYDNDLIKYYDDIFVFELPKKIIFGKKEYDFADILSCTMYDENHKDIPPIQVTRTKTGSMLGRAAVGGLTLGVAGAVVGALTAKRESISSIDNPEHLASYVIKIGIRSIEEPTITLKYGSDKSKAEEVYALMQAIIAMK
jgi:hypothetical protein